jgi:hypothetical protein
MILPTYTHCVYWSSVKGHHFFKGVVVMNIWVTKPPVFVITTRLMSYHSVLSVNKLSHLPTTRNVQECMDSGVSYTSSLMSTLSTFLKRDFKADFEGKTRFNSLHSTNFRGTIESKFCWKYTLKEHNYFYISRRFKRRNWSFHRFPEFLLSRLFFCFMSFKPSRKWARRHARRGCSHAR